MRISRLIMLAFAMASAASPVFAQEQAQPNQVQVGRYQLVDATFSNSPDAPMKQFKRLVILDTATGNLTGCDYGYQDAGRQKDGREYWAANFGCGPFSAEPVYVLKAPKK